MPPFVDFLHHDVRWLATKAEHMILRMVAERVSFGMDPLYQFRKLLSHPPDDEERRLDAVMRELVEHVFVRFGSGPSSNVRTTS